MHTRFVITKMIKLAEKLLSEICEGDESVSLVALQYFPEEIMH